MHDPMTQAFRICYPWKRKGSEFHDEFITVWHVDPETDGSDDSCGWTFPRLTKQQRERIEYIAADEARDPWFLKFSGKSIDSPTEADTLLRGAFWLVGCVLRVETTHAERCEWACEYMNNQIDSFRSTLCFLPGYHSNREEDLEYDRRYCAEQFFYGVARILLRARRHWWQHPKWHLHHWKVNIAPVTAFKRWAFSKCCNCGKGFKWGYHPCGPWESTGPLWFRSERGIYHIDCRNPSSDNVACAANAPATQNLQAAAPTPECGGGKMRDTF